MSQRLEISRASTLLLIEEPLLDAGDAPITTATATLTLQRVSDDQVFDWADKTFKASGHTTPALACTHKGNGLYQALADLRQAGGGLAVSEGQLLRATMLFTLTSGATFRYYRELQCSSEVYAGMAMANDHQAVKDGSTWYDVVKNALGVAIGRHALTDSGGNPISDVAAGKLARRGQSLPPA